MKYENICIKKLFPEGPYKHTINFRDCRMLSNFTGRHINYGSACIRKKQYIITDIFGSYYVIDSLNGKKINADAEINEFYETHIWENGVVCKIQPIVMPTKEQIKENKAKHAKASELLSQIEVKYGGVNNAEGTKEFLELQELLNVKEGD